MHVHENRLILSRAELRALLAFAAADDDVTRERLRGVFFSDTEAAATDGHSLVIAEYPTDGSKFQGRLYLRRHLEAFLKATSKWRGELVIDFNHHYGGTRVCNSPAEPTAEYTPVTELAVYDGSYPPYRVVVPKDADIKPLSQIGIAPHRLARLELISKAVARPRLPGEKTVPPTPWHFEFTHELGPIRCRPTFSYGAGWTVALMPCRI